MRDAQRFELVAGKGVAFFATAVPDEAPKCLRLARMKKSFRLVNDEIRLIGSVMYGRAGSASEYAVAVNEMPRFKAELALLQTHTFGLGDAEKAFETALDKTQGAMKVAIRGV